jgi:REP element-mobilizing transposase RayT
MARIARIVVPGLPHHVTQRGNRRERVLFEEGDYALYRDLLAAACRKAVVAVWAYCLMPNHVHLILVPADATGLARTLSETHRRYVGYVNARARESLTRISRTPWHLPSLRGGGNRDPATHPQPTKQSRLQNRHWLLDCFVGTGAGSQRHSRLLAMTVTGNT